MAKNKVNVIKSVSRQLQMYNLAHVFHGYRFSVPVNFCRSRTDRRTDGHTMTTYTALA